MIMPT